MKNFKNETKIINRKQFVDTANEASKIVSEVIGSTMTSSGKYVSLLNGTITNDGVTIIPEFKFDDHIKQDLVERLRQAAMATDENSGDGTSATTVLTAALIDEFSKMNYIGSEKKGKPLTDRFIEDSLVEANEIAISTLKENVKELNTKEDYIKLATISTKDKKLGKLIGEAFHESGRSAIVSIKQSTNYTDYVKLESAFQVPVNVSEFNLPLMAEDVDVAIVNRDMKTESAALRSLVSQAFIKKRNLIIFADDIGDVAIRFVSTANQMNEATGVSVMLSPIPQSPHRSVTKEEIKQDIAAFTGAVSMSEQTAAQPLQTMDKIGKIDKYVTQNNGLFLSGGNPDGIKNRVEELSRTLAKGDSSADQTKSLITRNRMTQLEGKIVNLHIYAATPDEMNTKKLRVEDAVKSTQFAIGYGMVTGAGSIFREIYLELKSMRNIFADAFLVIEKTIYKIADKDFDLDKAVEVDITKGLDVVSGEIVDLYDEGIVDSARVTFNTIVNSTSIANSIIKPHFQFSHYTRDE